MWIYFIRNLINNKGYVGQTKFDPRIRFDQHCKQSGNSYLNNSIKKYGKENFVFYKVKKTNYKNTKELENLWIQEANTLYPNGYNLKTADKHCVYSEISKEKMKKSHLGKISPRKGTKLSKETKEKISNSLKVFNKNNPNHQTGSKNPRFGKSFTKEQREKRSKLLSGKNNPFYGKKHSELTKQKISKSKKKNKTNS